MEVINSSSVYLTVGDLGFSKIGDRSARGDLGSVFKISKSKIEKISNGHRNQQGVVLTTSGELITSEHGPRGGDEINIIKKGMDYGWPFVTYGEPYSQGDYVIPGATGTHKGFPEPIQVWTPSIAPTELVQLPRTGYGRFSSGLVMGTLRENSLVFMKLSEFKVEDIQIVEVNHRIRDLDLLPNGRILASTDEGELLIFTPR
jgi:glucose/arabinose dehydrogenase